jgi:hypothetical protein
VPAGSAGSGNEPVAVDIKITGLTRGTNYYWRVSATNASGKATSGEVGFLSSFHPAFEMPAVTSIGRTGATLNATIKRLPSKYWFEYGTTSSYGSKTTVKETSGEVETISVSEPISGLKPNTVYHYRVVAENFVGSHTSADLTFTTLSNATLYLKGGEQLKAAAPLKAFSNSLAFVGESGTHGCGEAEFAGTVKENPGALQAVTAKKIQNGPEVLCFWKPSYWIAYSIPTEGMTIEYAKNGAGEGFARTSKFTLIQKIYYEGSLLMAECEYGLTLTGTFKTLAALESTLSGKTEVIKGNFYCPGPESVSGKFVVTSGVTAVEAK